MCVTLRCTRSAVSDPAFKTLSALLHTYKTSVTESCKLVSQRNAFSPAPAGIAPVPIPTSVLAFAGKNLFLLDKRFKPVLTGTKYKTMFSDCLGQ